MEDGWLSVDEIAAYLGVKRDMIYKWIDVKSLPAHRLGRPRKFKKADIDRWVVKGVQQIPAPNGGLVERAYQRQRTRQSADRTGIGNTNEHG